MFGLGRSNGDSAVRGGSAGKGKSGTHKEKRKAPRFDPVEIKVRLDGRELTVVNISTKGVFVQGAPSWIVEGQGIVLELMVPIRSEIAYVPIQGRVTRKGPDGIGIRYMAPHTNWDRMILSYLKKGRK